MSESEASRAVTLREDGEHVRILIAGTHVGPALRSVYRDQITVADVERLTEEPFEDLILRFRRASTEAKRLLRERRVPYASDDGEIFFLDPPAVAIHQSPGRRPSGRDSPSRSPQPFAPKASRVARWLLLHAMEATSPRRLARATGLSEAAVSQTVTALSQRLLVEVSPDQDDARVKQIRVPKPARLLEEWVRSWETRNVRQLRWDVGANGVADTLSAIEEVSDTPSAPDLAIGGLAGAAMVHRVVEPADVLLWVRERELPRWEQLLVPLGTRQGRGTLRLAIAPDPFLFTTTTERGPLRLADPVQLCLDTAREGERALEAHAAIREVMGW